MNSGVETHSRTKTVLGLIASPRKLGNCEVFVKEIGKNLPHEYRLNLIRLPDLRILPCNACYGCIMGNPCPHHDDMAFLLSSIAQAEAVIIASPVYFFGAHSIIKRILDRGFLFYNILNETYGKPCILINIFGIRNRLGIAPQNLISLALFLGLDVKTVVQIQASLPGEIIMKQIHTRKAERLAGMLFSKKKERQTYGCPFCGCDVVRIEKRYFVCGVCQGHFSIDGKGRRIKIREGGIVDSLSQMLHHRDVLRGYKNRFLVKRREILKKTLPYQDRGEWIKPPML